MPRLRGEERRQRRGRMVAAGKDGCGGEEGWSTHGGMSGNMARTWSTIPCVTFFGLKPRTAWGEGAPPEAACESVPMRRVSMIHAGSFGSGDVG